MACLARLIVALSAYATTSGVYPAQAQIVQVQKPMPSVSNEQPQHQLNRPSPAVFLTFRNPVNGSTVDEPTFELGYTLTAARGGRELTEPEVNELTSSTTMCFQLGASLKAPVCAPLTQTWVTLKGALPATWHTVTATLSDTALGQARETGNSNIMRAEADSASGSLELAGLEKWKDTGDSLTVFVGLKGFSQLPLCGESSCLDSSDVRSAYFDHIYR